ncbi:hypothetical protein ACFW04_014037 [Cataglyphis niger]
MKKKQTGRVTIRKEKFWTMTYADDMVLLAKSKEELKGMLKRFKKYLEKRELILSPEKSNIIVFENEEEERRIESIKGIKYLGYILQKNERAEKQVRERFKRTMIVMKKTWSIGELFKNDYRGRTKMFDALVGSVVLYGAEIWERKNEARLDKIKRKRTPNYILVEETKMIEQRIETMRRVIKYEGKARNSDRKIIIECIKDSKKERKEGEESKWEATRRTLLKRIKMEKEELKKREKGNQEIEINTEAEDRVCRICEKEEESIEHVIRECLASRNDMQISEFLSEKGKGLEIMKRIEQEKGKKGKEKGQS